MSDGELYQADRDLRAKLALDPGNAAYYFELSNIDAALFDRTRKGKYPGDWLSRSGEALEKVVMLDPGNKVAHYNLGVVYKRQGLMEKAREQFRKGLARCREEEEAALVAAFWVRIGETYAEQGFYEEAREAYLKARDYDYQNPDIQEAIEELRVRMQTAEEGRATAPLPMVPGMGAGMSAAGMVGDPVAREQYQNQGIAQALPYLGQMVAQKFSGGGSSEEDGYR
ncbi:MAG: tetratricopeptide repeat protein [Candidatus Omnitrophica bacterium]|nr:tetratricopeptide repeat protein [Candidatus Omnitrophota bacterium]